ncbi:sigma-70 family RNA polymerase sigma factor [Streptacidiphilus sp. P02-A3a]|uniref:sigma-70 family RNA polymerase sigma factor n=1 Tax=Streptacidiphilus sp. P02-A3a TaxID=2704468 RepID=UPI0015FE0EAE|nr:sigma-70 family RNA polymerase sigma factor [Streptacidiphilus sp. P02-A3a]QMU69889.1 sigma-70 family RNA polymerase sigma factor [Streptacidiphilus sp. P02-A3a]
MRTSGWGTAAGGRRTGANPVTVLAARDGDTQAMDAVVAQSLPLVYNIVGRALNGHPDTDDVVQETMLRVVRGLPELRQPESYRSWLVAIAVRQARDRERERRDSQWRQSTLDTAAEIPDPASDFVALTVLRLGLTDQRREVAEATRWLDADYRELLALWWLEESGELPRAELAEALGLTGRHAAVRIQRMKEQLETARTVVRALEARPRCAELDAVALEWDGVPGALWRKRLARHVRECGQCEPDRGALLPLGRLLGGLPLLPVPSALHARLGVTAPAPAAAPGRAALRAGRAARRGRALPVSVAVTGVAAATAGVLLAVGLAGHPSAPGRATAATAPLAATPAALPTRTAPSRTPSAPTGAAHRSAPARTAPARTAPAAPPNPSAAAAPTTGAKKGVGAWSFPGVDSALTESGADWYFTWSTQHPGIDTPARVGFVPMIWGAGSVTAAALAQARAEGPYLLGFNEPDMTSQSNLSVSQALSLWPRLMATGDILGSPAVATGAATPGGWLDQFMSGAKARGYRVDFIALHWYGGDFDTTQAVDQLQSYVQAVYDRYHLPIWLTEYALINFSGGVGYPTGPQQAAFVTASTRMLTALPYLQRYAWFALPGTTGQPGTGLFTNGPVATDAGRAFEQAAG